MNNKFSVLIPDGEPVVALHVARCLAPLPDVKLYTLSSRNYSWCRFSRYCRPYNYDHNYADEAHLLSSITTMVKKHQIDVIHPVSRNGIEFVINHHQALAEVAAVAPVPALSALTTADNKWRLLQLAQQTQLPVPATRLVTLDANFFRHLPDLSYPVLLKPTQSFGGRGIRRFDTSSELQRFLETADEEEFKNNYVVQAFVPGTDLGLSVLCRQGEILAHTIQQGLVAQRFGPLRAMQFIEHEVVLEQGQKLVAALNWSGVAHIDMRSDERDNTVKILEMNPRYWNSLLGSLVVGVNFPYLACLAALDIPFTPPEYSLGKYLYTATAAKEMALRLVGRNRLNGFTLGETGLRFFLKDPLPEAINMVAKKIRIHRSKHARPNFKFLNDFLTEWFPNDGPYA